MKTPGETGFNLHEPNACNEARCEGVWDSVWTQCSKLLVARPNSPPYAVFAQMEELGRSFVQEQKTKRMPMRCFERVFAHIQDRGFLWRKEDDLLADGMARVFEAPTQDDQTMASA